MHQIYVKNFRLDLLLPFAFVFPFPIGFMFYHDYVSAP